MAGTFIRYPIASLTVGIQEMVNPSMMRLLLKGVGYLLIFLILQATLNLDLNMEEPVSLYLAVGSGPIVVTGQQEMICPRLNVSQAAETDCDFSAADMEEDAEEEQVPTPPEEVLERVSR